MVKVEDIWVISDSDIESLRKQADELSKPLERTSYFAQGVTLKSDINVSLDKILSMKNVWIDYGYPSMPDWISYND